MKTGFNPTSLRAMSFFSPPLLLVVLDARYRFFLAMFLHAGAIHLFVVLLLQFSLLPDVERIAGWWRVGESWGRVQYALCLCLCL